MISSIQICKSFNSTSFKSLLKDQVSPVQCRITLILCLTILCNSALACGRAHLSSPSTFQDRRMFILSAWDSVRQEAQSQSVLGLMLHPQTAYFLLCGKYIFLTNNYSKVMILGTTTSVFFSCGNMQHSVSVNACRTQGAPHQPAVLRVCFSPLAVLLSLPACLA